MMIIMAKIMENLNLLSLFQKWSACELAWELSALPLWNNKGRKDFEVVDFMFYF